MGQTLSYCCPCLSNEYTAISDESTHNKIEIVDIPKTALSSSLNGGISQSYQAPSSSAASAPTAQPVQSLPAIRPTAVPSSVPMIDFDMNSTIFKGSVVQQKFFNKSTYEAKFAWINLKGKTLCLSEHMTKERRHKEASLADVTGVICGPPEKYKAMTTSSGEPIMLDPNLCLSVKFIRGGGIDLKFPTMKDRDDWADVILRLINTMKKNDLPRQQ